MREGEGEGKGAGEEGSVIEKLGLQSHGMFQVILQWTYAMAITVLKVSSMKRPSNILYPVGLRHLFSGRAVPSLWQ